MAGVVLHVPSPGTNGAIAAHAQQLGVAARTIEITVAAIAEEELEAAVLAIKRISPIKTGDFMRAWKVVRLRKLDFRIVNLVKYAGWVHRRGEKGTLFVDAYAKPEIDAAVRRIRVRILEAMRDAVRAKQASAFAPAIRRGIVASQLRFGLAGRLGLRAA